MTTSAIVRTGTIAGLAVAGLTLAGTAPALAGGAFELEEPGVEKGEVEAEYRGAVFFGLPNEEGEDDEEEEAELQAEEEEEEAPVRQAHDFEVEYGVTEHFKFSATLGTDEPENDNFDVSSVSLEGIYEFVEREEGEDGWAMSFLVGYGFATRVSGPDEIEFGPIFEFASGAFTLTTNTFLVGQVGNNVESDGLGFEYGWRGEYEALPHWGIGVEMFGEVEDLSNTGPWEEQEHSIGPTLFWNPGDDDDDDGLGHDHDDPAGPPEMELSFNVGVQLGLTDATPDSALKFQGSLEF